MELSKEGEVVSTLEASYELNLNDGFARLIRYIFRRQTSSFIIIFGRRESGKTDMSLLILEILFQLGLFKHFASNVKINDSYIPIENISTLIDLTDWAEQKKGNKLFILDEAGRAFKRRTPMSKLNVEIIDKLQILRKFKLSLIFVTPNERYLDSTALGSDVVDGIFRKPNPSPSFDNRKIALYDDQLEQWGLRFWSVPPTSIKFDTWDSAPFTMGTLAHKRIFKDESFQKLSKYEEGQPVDKLWNYRVEFHRDVKKMVREMRKIKYNK